MQRQPDGSFQVRGNLTIRNTFKGHAQNGAAARIGNSRVSEQFGGADGALCATKPVLLRVRMTDSSRTLPLQGSSVVRMRDFGLKPPSALLGALGTRDEMDVRFGVVAAR
ncbi:MAG: YceI family protein [Acidobacteriia bacterium]|nr:YceI family protein [Terriglobia bacterium]